MINKETFILGQKIRYFRNRMNLSQMDLGVSTGLSFGTISRIENGTINPNKETIEKILDSLHISLIERSYVSGKLSSPPTNEEVKVAIQNVQPYFNKRGVIAYLSDDRYRVWEVSADFIKLLNMSNSQKESLRGKSLVKIFLDESLGISKFLDPEHKKEMLTNFLARVYSETGFMINDESYKEVVSYINKDEIAKEIWNKMESGFEMNIHNLETRKISFKFRNFSKAMNYSIEQLMNNERFKISEYIPNNYIIRALSKLY